MKQTANSKVELKAYSAMGNCCIRVRDEIGKIKGIIQEFASDEVQRQKLWEHCKTAILRELS